MTVKSTSPAKTLKLTNGVYQGETKDGIPDGEGQHNILRFHNNNNYQGQFREGTMHGKGIFQWADGHSYVGSFENNDMHGHGRYKCSCGTIRKGNWSHGERVPGGHIIKPDGTIIPEVHHSKTEHNTCC